MLDKNQESEQCSAADFLANSGIPTVIDAKHQIAHNKVILVVGRTLITGSFNFTTNAEKSNAEVLQWLRLTNGGTHFCFQFLSIITLFGGTPCTYGTPFITTRKAGNDALFV